MLSSIRKKLSLPTTGVVIAMLASGQLNMVAGTVDWGVAESGSPGIYSWQHLYNWNAAGLHQSPLLVPSVLGDIANLHLVNLTGNQTINLDGAVTLGTLNIGDTSGQQSYILAAGSGGALTLNNGGLGAAINKSGIGYDYITSNITLADNATITVNEGALGLTGVISGAGFGITKEGDGMLILRGSNTFTGANVLNGGVTLLAPIANDGAVLGTTAGPTNVSSGATLALGPDAAGSGAIGNPAEPITINGNGFRNNGALRNLMGANGAGITSVITLGSASKIQNDLAGTLTISSAMNVNQDLRIGGASFVSLTGVVSGTNTITHYGISGFRFQGVSTYSGTISSELGEIRADTQGSYNNVSAFNIKNGVLQIVHPNNVNVVGTKLPDLAPINLTSGRLYSENSAFGGTGLNPAFTYTETVGPVTILAGNNQIGMRAMATTGSNTLTIASLSKPNAATTLQLSVDSVPSGGSQLGLNTQNRLLDAALETAGVTVPFVGGWAYTNAEFVKYVPTTLGGNGYTALVAADYSTTAETGWNNTLIVKPSAAVALTADRQVKAIHLNGQTISGAFELNVDTGGIIANGGSNINTSFLTAGAAEGYELKAISWSTLGLNTVIQDNGINPVSFVKAGGSTTSFFQTNTYTGTTYINEGVLREVIGVSSRTGLGSGNLTFYGYGGNQSVYETDRDFTRALGAGAGEVQFLGGTGSGFSAFGAPIDLNFGGAGATVTWGSSTFNPGIFTLNGGNATHVLTMINPLDLGGEQRYIRLDGSASGSERAVIGVIAGDVSNGSIVKRGGGILLFETPKTYEGGTLIQEGELWLRGTGTAGANVTGNDIQVGSFARLRINDPSNIGSRQMIILQNNDSSSATGITFGPGYGTGAGITFSSLTATGGLPASGPYNILIANNQSGQGRRIGVTISGLNDFQADLLGQIATVAPNVEAWFGADNGNGVYTGSTLTATGTTKAFRLGGFNGTGSTLTIANANVLNGAFPLIVGAADQNDRQYIDGTIYIPRAQGFSGQITIGNGGILWAGENGALGTGTADILLRAGELRLDSHDAAFGGYVGTQYSGRNINVAGGTGTIRSTTLGGGGFNTMLLGNIIIADRDSSNNRVLQIQSIGTNFTDIQINNLSPNMGAAGNFYLDVGTDNSFQAGVGILTVNGVIDAGSAGAHNLRKRQGGVLILNSDNTYDGGTFVEQGRLVLSNTGAAGLAGSTITLSTNNDRRSDLEYRINGAGPFLFDNPVATTGGNDGSSRVIVVGPTGAGSENQNVQIPSLTIGHGGVYTQNGGSSSAVYFDGFNGYTTTITGNVNLNRSIVMRTRGALTTINGAIVSNAATNILEKSEQGTLWLNGASATAFDTVLSNGYLVLANGSALGTATTDINMRNNVFSQLLLSGTTNLSRNIINTATGSTQTLGGLDAGAKTFSGNINLSTRGVALTAITGGDTTFSGVISGGFGIDKQGNGTVILTNANTYTGTTTVTQGLLIGNAQTAGSPFGTGAMSVLDAEVRLQGLAAPAANHQTVVGALSVSGGARVAVNDVAADTFATELNFASLARVGQGTVAFVPVRGDLGGEENFTFVTAPTLVNTIVGAWAYRTVSGTNNAADYVTMSGSNLVTATYGGTGDLDLAAGGTQVFNAGATGGTLTADRSVFAFRTDANVNLAGFTLNVGDNATPANGGGMILNAGADITGASGSKINLGNTALVVYTDDAAVSSLNVPVTNTRNNANNTLSTVFVKAGAGTLELGAAQTFQGNIELNRGTISTTAANVFPMFENLNGKTGSVVTLSPGTSLVLNNFDQEIGNLAAVNPSNEFQFSAGTLNLGTATLTVGRDGGSQGFNGRIVGGAGSKIAKVGGGTLTLDNINGNIPNTLATLEVNQGGVSAWVGDQSWAKPTATGSAIPSSTTVVLRGGQFTALAVGDSTGNFQRINIGNNIVHQGGDSILRVDRPTGGGSNKLLTFGNLTLDVQRFLTNSGNAYIARIDGTTTLTNHARVQTDSSFVIAGAITDGGKGYTMNKIGGSDLAIGGDSSGTWTGGLVVTGGTLLFGTRGLDDIRSPGTTFVPTATANAGTGDIIVNQGSVIRLNAPSNVLTAQGQEVRIFGSERGSTTRVDLQTDADVTAYGLRSLTDGSIALGLSEGTWTTPINMARVGNGNWGISALSNTYYMPTTLGAGLDNVYRFNGSAGGTLSIMNSGVVTGTASVVVGKDPIFAGGTPGGSGAIIRFYGDQNYTGNTTIFRVADGGSLGGFLELTGDSASPTFDVYGRLTLRGAGRLTNDAGTQVNTLNLRPGGDLRLDYNMDVADSIFNSRLNESNLGLETTENKLGDTTPLVLDGAAINLINSGGRVNTEVVGAITIKGGAGITLERNGTNGQILLYTPSITRTGQATLSVRPTSSSTELGSINLQSSKLILTGGAPALTNGIVAPWAIDAQNRNFLSYNTTTGYTVAPFVTGTVTAGGGDAFLSTFTGTEIVRFAGGWGTGTTGVTTLTGTKNVYALRVDEDTSTRDAIFQGGQINILSGGLIAGADDTNRVNFDTTNIYFGDGAAPVEGMVYGFHNSTNTRFGGVVTASNLTFTGPGGFQMTNTANAITGTIQLNGGRLYLDGAGTQGTATEIILQANYSNNFNGGQMPDLRLRHNSATTTYTGLTVTVAENVPFAFIQAERFSGAGNPNTVQFQNLKVLGTTGPAGTLLQLFNSNSNTDVLGTTTIGGTSAVGMNVNANTWRMIGSITTADAAPIVKTGDGTLRWDGDNSGFTGGFTLNRGEWRLTPNNTANYDVGGTGDVELNFGTVRMAVNGASSIFTAPGQDIAVNGQVTFITDRNGGASAATRTIGVNNQGNIFRTTNSPYIIWQAATFGDDIILESQLQINGSPTFRTDSTDLFLRDVVSGSGTFNKGGIWYLHFDNNAANTFSGGFNNFTGVTAVRQANATLGTGPVQVFAGTGLSIPGVTNLGGGGLKIYTSGTALPVIGTRTIANFNAVTAAVAAPGVLQGTGSGVLSIDAGQSLATDPLMATRDGGVFNMWNLAGGEGSGNLTANSVTPWGVGGTEFRLGGGFGTLTIGPATAGSAQFAGAGNKMILGVAHTVAGYGTTTFNANGNNTFDGGTLVVRGRNLDGGYRGFVLSVQGGANGATWRTPLGTGQIDLFGDMRYEGAAGTAMNTASTNANVLVMHPGSRLRFDNGTAFTGTGGGGRWADTVAIALNSSVLDMAGGNSTSAFNSETVGDISAAGGSEVVVRRSTAAGAELIAGNLTRTGTGTLMLRHDSGLLGANTTAVTTASANVDRFIVSNGASLMNNNMVDPWIVSRTDNQFLKYDATAGFQIITQGTTPANYLTSVGGTIDGTLLALNNGTEILNLNTATGTLGMNVDVYALRTDRDINNSADNAFNRITIRSGGLVQSGNTPTINPDLYFGATGTSEALIWASNNTLQINGKIYASQVTKSGTAFLNIRSDQPQFTGNWVINGGGIQFLTPGAQNTGEVILNGAHMADNDNVFNLNELRYNFNNGSPDLFTWGGGKITVNDLAIIRSIGATDRLEQIPAIDLKTSGGGHEGIIFFQSDASRHTVRTGTVTLYDHFMISTDATSFGPGSTSGVQLGSGTGTGGLNNQGLYDVRTTGDGVLSLGDNSASFTGNHTFSIGDGTVRVLHNGAFGASTVTAYARSTSAMEIAVPNFSPTATLIQEPGSIERWALSDARGTGAYSFAPGVNWQVFADITGTRTITMNGGSIMGYLPLDYDQVAVIQTIRSGVTIDLAADSFLGQNYPAGVSNGANHFMYDMGKLNTTTNLNPNDVGLRGSYLVIDGNITGSQKLTKVGQDVIKLAGTNTFSTLDIQGGIIQIGRDNALSPTVNLITRGEGISGILDLNGYNQEIGSLSGPSGSINNSAFENKTLTVNQATNTTYGGTIGGSVMVTKKGAGTLTFTAVNDYQGGTVLEAGTISVAADTSLGRVHLTTRADSLRFTGGTLQTTASFNIPAVRGITLDTAGGTIETLGAITTQIDSIVTGTGSLTKSGAGLLQLNNAANDYTGATNVTAGTLQASVADALAPLSRHVVTGDTTSGTLNVNGLNQTIGSLSSTGATQGNAVVAFTGTEVLTVGADRTQDAVYAGAVTGAGTFRVNGNGAVQTLSTFDNSAQTWNTQIANGVLNVANNAKLSAGTAAVQIGVTGVSGADDLTGLNLQNTATFANNIAVNNVNTVGSAFITSTGANSAITGTATLDRNIYAGAAVGTQLSLEGAVSGNGTITVVDGGTLRLTSANTYGTGVAGTSGTPMSGGTIVRAGSLLLENNAAAGSNSITIGDKTSTIGLAVDRATFTSILGSGSFNPNGDGVSATSGGQNAAGTTGFGAFIGVNSTVDGNTYTSGDVGARLLIAGEEANPERNGIYTIVSVSGGTMNLVRASDFQTGNQMVYGGQVAVTNGTYAGQTMFQFEEQIVVRNETTLEPIRFRQDVVNPNLSVLQNVSGLTVANSINVNATNGTGTVTIGASSAVSTGTGTFSGSVQLQDFQTGVSESKTVVLTSSTSASNGITFSGVINAADQVVGTADVLSIVKTGAGTVTLTNGGNNFLGTTTVSEGRLQVGNGGLAGTGSLTGTGAVSVTGAGTTLATAPVLAGGSGNTTIAGATTIGTATNPGILALGLADSATSNQSMTFSNASGITVANGSQIQMSVSTPTLDAGNGTVSAWLGSGLSLNDYITANPGSSSVFNVAPTTYGDLDYINLSAGGLSLGARSSGTFGNGSLLIQDNGWLSGAAAGDLFNLFDWVSAMTGSFAMPGTATTGGAYGDIDLPSLSGTLSWDLSALTSHGVIAVMNVIPEPSRALLLFVGLLGLLARRRRWVG